MSCPSQPFLWLHLVVPSYQASATEGFTSLQFHLLTLSSLLACLAGAALYKAFLTSHPLRHVLTLTTLLSSLLDCAPVLLLLFRDCAVVRWLGGDVPFVLLSTALSSTVGRLALGPRLTLSAVNCPKGLESSVFSGFLSVAHAAGLLAAAIS